jgi:hypothetical protein
MSPPKPSSPQKSTLKGTNGKNSKGKAITDSSAPNIKDLQNSIRLVQEELEKEKKERNAAVIEKVCYFISPFR